MLVRIHRFYILVFIKNGTTSYYAGLDRKSEYSVGIDRFLHKIAIFRDDRTVFLDLWIYIHDIRLHV